MDLSTMVPNRETPSFKVRRAIKPRRNATVWDFRKLTGNEKDLYVVKEAGHACKKVGVWSYRKPVTS